MERSAVCGIVVIVLYLSMWVDEYVFTGIFLHMFMVQGCLGVLVVRVGCHSGEWRGWCVRGDWEGRWGDECVV